MRVWTRRDGTAFAVTSVIALAVYVASLPPSITLEDAGELVVAADHLGVPHPPGYPLWTFLAWIFQAVLSGITFRGYPNPAWPVAFMSAVFGALACGLTAMAVCRFVRDLFSAGLSPRPLSQRIPIPSVVCGVSVSAIGFSLLHTVPSAGRVLLGLLMTGTLILLPQQLLTPAGARRTWQRALPTLPQWGGGALGFFGLSLCWIIAWGSLRIPRLPAVIILALGGVALIGLAMFLLDAALGKALRHPDLSQDFLAARADQGAGIAAGLLLAFTPLMWSQSVIAEVYSLNAFFVALLIALAYAYVRDPRIHRLYSIAFLFGLGLTNHQSLLFLFFFLVASVAAARRQTLLKDGCFLVGLGALGFLFAKAWQYHELGDPQATVYFLQRAGLALLFTISVGLTPGRLMQSGRTLGLLFMLGLLGLSFHLYMPIASSRNPPMDWGNTETWDGFVESVTRGQYARFSVADNLREIESTLSTPLPTPDTDPETIESLYQRRTGFLQKLGAYFWNPDSTFSIASQFSGTFDTHSTQEEASHSMPAERRILLAVLGLLPLLALYRLQPPLRHWISSTILAMFFLSVVFLIIQWPDLSLNDLWVKRVQYIQSHVLYAYWMGVGAVLLLIALYGCFPYPAVPRTGSILLLALFVFFPLHKEFRDSRHQDELGRSSLRHHDFGWQYGFHMLKGANGILLDELAHHSDPPALWNAAARRYALQQGVEASWIDSLDTQSGTTAVSLSRFTAEILDPLHLPRPVERSLKEAVILAGFRALPPEEQSRRLKTLHRPLPDWNYPAELAPEAILFGGTDPGRFVNTYMVFSAGVRPDVFVLTQNALAQDSYLTHMQDLYGDRIAIPTDADHEKAFAAYANDLRLYQPDAFARLMSNAGSLAVSGFEEVMKINGFLSKVIVDRNIGGHPVYVEESSEIPWMKTRLVPHGLIFRLMPEPVVLSPTEIQSNMDFWDWLVEELTAPATDRSRRFSADLQARKSYSKLRLAQAGHYAVRGLTDEAGTAFHQAVDLYPAGAETIQATVDFYLKQRRFSEARTLLDAFAARDPRHPMIHGYRDLIRTMQERDLERIRLEELLSYQPSGNTALQLLILYHEFGMEDRMEAMADLVLTLPRLSTDFYPELARILRRYRKPVLLEQTLLRWQEKDPRNPQPCLDLAIGYLVREDYPRMYRSLAQARDLDAAVTLQAILNDPRFVDIRNDPNLLRFLDP